MSDVELRVSADLDGATSEVRGFRKEWADMVRVVEKPLRQVNAFRELESEVEAAGREVGKARDRVRDLGNEMARTDRPSKQLTANYKDALAELQRLGRAEQVAMDALARRRRELQGAGIDTSNLVGEQKRLQQELASAIGGGRADVAQQRRQAAAQSIRAQTLALREQAQAQRQANIESARQDLGVTRYRALQAELGKLRTQYDLLRATGNLTGRELIIAQQQLTARIRETKAEMRQMAGGSGGQLGALAPVAAAVGGAVSGIEAARAFASLTDQSKQMTAQLKLATRSQEEFNRAQAETFRIAQENQAPIGDVVTLYSRLAPALRDAGRGQEDALKIIEAVTKSLRISGATAQETASTIQQFSQALGSGVLRGEEFNTLAESSPRLLRALADGLGVNVAALRDMAAEGKLTADVIANSLIGQLPKLTEEAAQMPETFGGALTKLWNAITRAVGELDKFAGVSDRVIGKVNEITAALTKASQGDASSIATGVSSLVTELARMVPVVDMAYTGASKLLKLFDLGPEVQAAEDAAKKEARVYDFRAERLRLHAEQVKRLRQQSLEDAKKILKQQVKDTKEQLAEQVAAERQAARDVEAAQKQQLDTRKRYQEALASLSSGAGGQGDYGQASALKVAARQALQSGDVEQAKQQAQAALAILQELAKAGENTYGFAGMMRELQAIEESADQQRIDDAQAKLDAAQAAAERTKAAIDELKDVKVTATMSPEDQQALLNQLAALAQQAGMIMTIPVTPVVGSAPSSDASANAAPVPGFARGGVLRGAGTGTSDSILARLSNGEGILTARAVSYWGAGVVHQLNRLQMPKFATGGVVGARSLPSIPSPGPSLQAQLAGPNFPDLGRVELGVGGHTFVGYIEPQQALGLKKLARKFGRPSANKG